MIGWKPGGTTAEAVTAKLTKEEEAKVEAAFAISIPARPSAPTFIVVTRRFGEPSSWSVADDEEEARRRLKIILETEGSRWPVDVDIFRSGGMMQWIYSESRHP